MSIQKLHYENISGTLVRREGRLSWRCPLRKAEGQSPGVMRTCPECGSKEAALPGAQPESSAPDTYAAGINAVAAMLQSKAAEYAKEHGHDDMGGLSFGSGMGGEIKMDYYTNLIELADDVRAMLAAAPKPEAKP